MIVGADLFPPAWLALHLVLTGEARVHWLLQPIMLPTWYLFQKKIWQSVENRLTHTLPYPHLFYLLGLKGWNFNISQTQHFPDSLAARILDIN